MSKRSQSYIEFPGTELKVAVPEDPEGEDEAVSAAFADLTASGRWPVEPGPAIPAEDLYRELGYTPPRGRHRRGRPPGTGKQREFKGRILVRVPVSVHRELAEQAAAEGTTINQLVLHYIRRGLGQNFPKSS